jgi:Glycine rich protein
MAVVALTAASGSITHTPDDPLVGVNARPAEIVMSWRGWHLIAIGAMAGAGLLLAPGSAVALPPGCSQSGQTVTCRYAAGSNPFTVPAGVSSVHVVAVGGTGGLGGGHGAVVSGDLAVSTGTTLFAVVGANGGGQTPGGAGGGAGGPGGGPVCVGNPFPPPPLICFGSGDDGGPGGGASDFRTSQDSLSSRLLIAGGGGGAGGGGVALENFVVVGGLDGADGSNGSGASGGAGGAGAGGFSVGDGSSGGSGFGADGGQGIRLTEVDGGVHIVSGGGGGGGGGGLFGGGGGGGGFGGSGGNGGTGSNLVPAGGSQSNDTTGVPMVQISYLAVPTSKDQCKNGGWRDFSQFKNQGDCDSFVNTGK